MTGERCWVCTACGQRTARRSLSTGHTAAPLCRNSWCAAPDRPLDAVFSIGTYDGALRKAIVAYKYRADLRWARVFGALLYGFLARHANWFEEYGVLCPVPSYLGPGARRRWGHVELLCAELGRLAGAEWPVQALVTKLVETKPMTAKAHTVRRHIARATLSRAIAVTSLDEVAGRRVVVIDDVCASGETLLTVARALRRGGAADVTGLVLARASWHPPTALAQVVEGAPDPHRARAVFS